jgi:hypothetical protein
MSKKKNTLKDLDEFLKQQAASIVEPVKLGKQVSTKEVILEKSKQEDVPGLDEINNQLKVLSDKIGISHRENLYDFVILSLESLDQSLPEDKMLINTALYLKSGNDWKHIIRQYWKNKK